MSVNLKNKTLLVHCSGSFFETALKLADYFKEVLYYVPWESGFPSMDKWAIGKEWENKLCTEKFDGKPFRRVESFYDNLQYADCIFHTDVYGGDQMEFLRELGYPVCSSGKLSSLELNRWETMSMFKQQGMDVGKMQRVVGIPALKEILKKVNDKYIKISKFRKCVETFHHETYELSLPILRKMEHELGPLSEVLEFIICDPIDAIVEEGVDAYSVNGKYPSIILSGIEKKDQCYAGQITPYEQLSKGVKRTNSQLSPIFKEGNYKGFFSTEVRTTKYDENYLIDFTARCPMPPSPLYGEMFANLGEIVWGIANGEMVDIKPKAKFGIYCTIYSEWYEQSHQAIYFDSKYRDNVKLNYPVKIDGNYYCININNFPEVGAVVAVGDSYEECKKKIEEVCANIKGHGITIKTEKIDEAIEEQLKTMNDGKVK